MFWVSGGEGGPILIYAAKTKCSRSLDMTNKLVADDISLYSVVEMI